MAERMLPIQPGCRPRVLLGGVSGSGMIGLARMGLQSGWSVCGCDRLCSPEVQALQGAGLQYFHEHQFPADLQVDLVVCSSALGSDHPVRVQARNKQIPVLRRAEWCARLLEDREIILVTGTHGKTTTSVLLAHALRKSGRDVSFYIGAEVPLFGTSAHLGTDRLAVVEGDESDGSFHAFSPSHLMILNVEADHLDHYQSEECIREAFLEMIKKTSGGCVLCQDDLFLSTCEPDRRAWWTYGLGENSRVRGTCLRTEPGQFGLSMEVEIEGKKIGTVKTALPGVHQCCNLTGVLAMGQALGEKVDEWLTFFEDVKGPQRRFDIRAANRFGTVMEDYAHHPTEIRVTLEAARSQCQGRLVVVFQPHRYSRTRLLGKAFAEALKLGDCLHLVPVYGAGEAEESGVYEEFAREVKLKNPNTRSHESMDSALRWLRTEWKAEDYVAVLGAGDISILADRLGSELNQAEDIAQLCGNGAQVRLYESLARHTTLRVGGPADVWVSPGDFASLAKILNYAKTRRIPVMALGRGSNLLVKDGGIRGLCVHLQGESFNRICWEGMEVTAGAGVRLKELVGQARKRGVGNFEFMEGIPGTVGGALRMNAGAMQSWMFDVLKSVEVMDMSGNRKKWDKAEISFGYRNVPVLADKIVLQAVFVGEESSPEAIKMKIRQYSEKRWSSQPAKPSAGCTFKNPEGIPAGKLIDEMGLKGKKIGGASVSSVHANFIVNDKGATAEDVLKLLQEIQNEVRQKRGIQLEPEVIICGESLYE